MTWLLNHFGGWWNLTDRILEIIISFFTRTRCPFFLKFSSKNNGEKCISCILEERYYDTTYSSSLKKKISLILWILILFLNLKSSVFVPIRFSRCEGTFGPRATSASHATHYSRSQGRKTRKEEEGKRRKKEKRSIPASFLSLRG